MNDEAREIPSEGTTDALHLLDNNNNNNNNNGLNPSAEPSTGKERAGWYLYSWAQTAYGLVALAWFPVLVSGMAVMFLEEQGLDEEGCVGVFTSNHGGPEDISSSCVRPSTVATSYLSLSSFSQMLFFIAFAPLADYGDRKKPFIITTVVAALFVAWPGFMGDTSYVSAGFALVGSNLCYGITSVFLNSFLPPIVENEPLIKREPDGRIRGQLVDSMLSSMSNRGGAAGYAAGVVLHIATIIFIYLSPEGLDNISIFKNLMMIVGAWWLGFGALGSWMIKSRPLPQLPPKTNVLTFGVVSFVKNVRDMVKAVPNCGMFLLAWIFASDGVLVAMYMGTIIALNELQLSLQVVLILLVSHPFVAMLGNMAWLKISERYKWSSKKGVMVTMAISQALPLYIILGFFPSVPFGLKATGTTMAAVEMLLFNIYLSIIVGAFQAFSRAMFSELIPPGKECEYFGLFEVSNQGSAWLSPLYFGYLATKFGSLRYGFGISFFQVFIGMFLMSRVNMEHGRSEAISLKSRQGIRT